MDSPLESGAALQPLVLPLLQVLRHLNLSTASVCGPPAVTCGRSRLVRTDAPDRAVLLAELSIAVPLTITVGAGSPAGGRQESCHLCLHQPMAVEVPLLFAAPRGEHPQPAELPQALREAREFQVLVSLELEAGGDEPPVLRLSPSDIA